MNVASAPATTVSLAKGAAAPTAPSRLVSLDAYRGLVMLLMLAEVLALGHVAQSHPESLLWKWLAFHQSHVEWVGCSLHDLIQPSFTFMVGVALPFSLGSRRAQGQKSWHLAAHAFWRALILITLGIFLRSLGRSQTYFTFEDTLTQIGLGYGFLFLIGLRPRRDHWLALVLILVGYWAAFALYPLPGLDFDWKSAGVDPQWSHPLQGLAAHWNKNSNAAWAFDRWFMNLWPREKPFLNNGGGYSTLSFIPTLGTMVVGLLAGGVMKSDRPARAKLQWLAVAGLCGVGGGLLLGVLGLCPVVKRIWTPSWVLFSGGLACWILALFYYVIDLRGWKAWAFPLVVIGMNSIAAYCSEWFLLGFFKAALQRHLGKGIFTLLGPQHVPLLLGGASLLVLWSLLFWMYRRRLFLRI